MGFGGSAHALSQADEDGDGNSAQLERQLRRDLRRQLKVDAFSFLAQGVRSLYPRKGSA